jgi:TonB family protein
MSRIDILLFVISWLRKLWDKHCAEWFRQHQTELYSAVVFTVAIGSALVSFGPQLWIQHQEKHPPPLVAEKDLTSAPDWLRKPDSSEMEQYFPERAQRQGISGFAVITCISYPDNRVRNCKVGAEGPHGYGFGNAAIRISRKMRFRPGRDAQGAVHATVRVPLNFVHPDNVQLLNGRSVLTPPKRIWDKAPSFEDLESALPAQTRTGDVVVRVECKVRPDWNLSDCGLIQGAKSEPNAVRAALGLTSKFRLFAEPWTWAVVHPTRVRFSIWFQRSGFFEGGPYRSYWATAMKDPDQNPELVKLGEQMGVNKVVGVNCTISFTGVTENCRSPESGKSESLLLPALTSQAEGAQFDLWSRYGTPIRGGLVSMRYRPNSGQGPAWSF